MKTNKESQLHYTYTQKIKDCNLVKKVEHIFFLISIHYLLKNTKTIVEYTNYNNYNNYNNSTTITILIHSVLRTWMTPAIVIFWNPGTTW